jgi:hypothetical protein
MPDDDALEKAIQEVSAARLRLVATLYNRMAELVTKSESLPDVTVAFQVFKEADNTEFMVSKAPGAS